MKVELERGIYKATVNGVTDQIVMSDGVGAAACAAPLGGFLGFTYGEAITDARPLTIIDLGERQHREYVLDILRQPRHDWTNAVVDQIEAQTRPARIPEPGWGEKVRAWTAGNGHEREFLRYKVGDPDFRWADGCEQYRWADLIDPEQT